ncbi:hypothetical protein HanIR_Chr03g0123371 [Helianthus annuus]|nr:hypothetical protein HanIR_Chr03g0123371 [Helianthus annuus]
MWKYRGVTYWRSASWSSSHVSLPPLVPDGVKDGGDVDGSNGGLSRRSPKVAEQTFLSGDAVAKDKEIPKQHKFTHILNWELGLRYEEEAAEFI